ncbi:AAA family ATPase [Noviherbaspirillum soli]|uniref:AAA family ATPase n=1 Tax=Noviherbaspirillum soli TaxID=1064518 RepID=UPI00188BFC85|nr:AAA family ATPase [Noviherbaspirillum soli]
MNGLRIAIISPSARQMESLLALLPAGIHASAYHGTLASQAAHAALGAPDLLVADLADGAASDALLPLQACAGVPVLALSLRQDAEFLLAAMRAGVREVLPLPPDGQQLRAALERVAGMRRVRHNARGKLLAFVSCKGGSGATFLAANLAYALAAAGSRTALLDFNLQFGDALLFLSDRAPVRTLADLAHAHERLDATFLAASMTEVGPLSVLAAAQDPAQAADILPDHLASVLALARSRYDHVVVDVGRNLDARSLRALDQADLIYPVLQITLPFIRDGRRLLEVFGGLGYGAERISPVVNRHERRGDIGIAEVEQTLGMAVARTIPNHYAAAAASVNQGVPIIRLAGRSPVSRALRQWSAGFIEVPVARRRWMPGWKRSFG